MLCFRTQMLLVITALKRVFIRSVSNDLFFLLRRIIPGHMWIAALMWEKITAGN